MPQRSGRELFESNLPLLAQVIGRQVRRGRLRPQEAEDFSSYAHCRLLERDSAILTHFAGEDGAQLPAYLSTVARRLYVDFLRLELGRWRPSARAARLGPAAVRLEQLLERDGKNLAEVADQLIKAGEASDAAEVERLVAAIPRRSPPAFEGAESLARLTVDGGVEERVRHRERRRAERRLAESLRRAWQRLDPVDRRILALRFREGCSARVIGLRLGLAQRAVYYRLDRGLRQVRCELEGAGFDGGDIEAMLAEGLG